MVPVPKDGALAYGDAFAFDVAPGHVGELRVRLVKKRARALALDAKPVVACAGLYAKNLIAHITAHGAIDKAFELFTEGGDPSGGFVRLRVAYVAATPEETERADPAAEAAAAKIQARWRGKQTRERLRRASGRHERTERSGDCDENAPLSPASVAKACGVVAVAAFAASVGVARGRRSAAQRG